MKKSSFVFAVIVIIVFSFLTLSKHSFAGGAVEPLEKADRPTWQVGDTWIYQQTDTAGPKSVIKFTVIESNVNGYILVFDNGNKKTVDYYNKDLNYVRSADEKDKPIDSCKPEIPLFKWPLEVGKKWWEGTYYYTDFGLYSGNVTLKTELTGAETLISPDGKEVATLKLLSKRYNKSGAYFGKSENWYDPQSLFIFKRINEQSSGRKIERNLTSFTRGGPML